VLRQRLRRATLIYLIGGSEVLVKFTHLHVHSHYSLLDGLSKVPDLVKKAVEQGATALALTDHGVMYGAIELYKECKKAGIKPIIGCEAYITKGSMTDREPRREGGKNFYHLTLLAKNHEGYVNLMKMTTEAHLKGFYYKPRIDHDLLTAHHEGVICLSGCLASELAQAILHGTMEEARAVLEWHRDLFGDDYYLEVQHHPNIPDQIKVNEVVIGFGAEYGIPIVLTTDSHYLCADDSAAQDVLICVQTGALVSDTNRMNMTDELFDLKSPEELAEGFASWPEALENTQLIADKVDLEIPMGELILPVFEFPEGDTADSFFAKKIEEGIRYRYGENASQEVLDRVEYEIGVIKKAGYMTYMLIVADFINWAKDHGIMVGPGRGSAAGSMVAYILRITDLDPLHHNLLFERFLNPERISMPDIDIDFADDRRGEVIEYVRQKYGASRVAQIVTFGTMASRAAVRDVGRVLAIGYSEVDRIAKLIPPPQQGKYTPLATHIAEVAELQEEYTNDEQIRKLLDLSMKLEGTIRHASTHAAGVVIGDKDLVNYTPLQKAPAGDSDVLVTQYSMYPVEAVGLLKMDFLGLKNLTIIQNALRIIKAAYGVDVDMDKLPLDDPKTFELLAAADTTGVFQLEGDGMRRYLKELKPTVFNDISVMIALYRPGPIEFIPEFIARKHGKKRIEYVHPDLEPILKETYGIAVFQEQVMRIATDICGFTLGEADVLRKAMGKKIPALMMEQKEKFVAGALAQGVDKAVADKLFTFVEPFALYGFNRAHSASYGMISYWTAYLKAHYRSAFMAAVMTSGQGDLDDVAKFISECEKAGIRVLPPSVNKSFTDFAIVPETGEIVFGLNAIKNVGRKVSEVIIEERKTNGEYEDLTDFVKRAGREVINKKTLEGLILAGALDAWGERNTLYLGVEKILEFASNFYTKGDTSQMGMFDDAQMGVAQKIILPVAEFMTEKERLTWEREFLGTFVSHHPIKDIMPKLDGLVRPIHELKISDDNKVVRVAGIVTRVQKVMTKKGDAMLFATIEDLGGSIEAIVFPKVLESTKKLWERDKVLIVSGKVNVKEHAEDQEEGVVMVSEPKILADDVREADDKEIARLKEADGLVGSRVVAANTPPPVSRIERRDGNVVIKLPKGFTNGRLTELKAMLAKYPGEEAIALEVFAGDKWQMVPTQTKLAVTEDLEKELAGLLN
jgi:DNA polymerase-3 subunit alpha